MADWSPFWTEEVKIEGGGRFPLLLNRFHDHLEDYLIKQVVSVTSRLRYISYCCWAIGDIENTMVCEKYSDFEEAFRRRETALAIGLYLLKPESLINYPTYGERTMAGRITGANRDYETSLRLLPSSALGPYGQYYKGTMQNWGLTYIDDNGVIRLTSLGTELYKTMDDMCKKSDYYNSYKGENEVPGQILYDWAIINQYDGITTEKNKEEREFYKNILFHLDTKKGEDGRRDTFTIYLECLKEAERINSNFDESVLRNILYYEKYRDSNGNLHNFSVSHFLEDTRFIWMIYEMHVYFRWWISEFFRMFLRLLSASGKGLSLDEVIAKINKNIFNETIEAFLGKEDYLEMIFGDLIKKVKQGCNDINIFYEDELTFGLGLVEEQFLGFSEVSAGLLIMLGLLNHRSESIQNVPRYNQIRMNLSEDFWVKDILERVESFKEKNVKEVLKIILEHFVIKQHNIAMFEKKDLRRCWFTLSDNRYQFQADANSIWRPAKHDIIMNFIFDMGLMTVDQGRYRLTQEGNDLYSKLKDDYYEE